MDLSLTTVAAAAKYPAAVIIAIIPKCSCITNTRNQGVVYVAESISLTCVFAMLAMIVNFVTVGVVHRNRFVVVLLCE